MPETNILDLKLADYVRLSMPEVQMRQLQTVNTSRIKDLAGLRQAILEYVHWGSLNQRPARLGTLNRRFNRLAYKFETSTSNIVMELAGEGLIHSFEVKNQTILATVAYLREVKEGIPDDAERLEARQRFLSQAE